MAETAEAERYRRAWNNRRLRSVVAVVFVVAVLAALVAISNDSSPEARWPLMAAAVAVFALPLGWMYAFRCPRCREIFAGSVGQSLFGSDKYRRACAHCGLKKDEIPGETRS